MRSLVELDVLRNRTIVQVQVQLVAPDVYKSTNELPEKFLVVLYGNVKISRGWMTIIRQVWPFDTKKLTLVVY